MDYSPILIGKTVRRLRCSLGQSQEVFSGLAGIGRSHLAMIECGTKAANIETLAKISRAFDMKLSELFLEIEKEQSDSTT
ncbi:MAG: helix-turn-helix transcriptional regulator [Clostridia bacterium]|nr:helix-turn-helix transcriptional regulator [Clostridia bacterium]